jgi:ERCC4-type nuclease
MHLDTDDVVALKKHIADLYASINDDLFVKQQEQIKKKFN